MIMFNNDFIEIYDKTLSKNECDQLIKFYENEDPNNKVYGAASPLNIAKKLALTLSLDLKNPYHSRYNNCIIPLLSKYTKKYKEKYSYLDKQEYWDVCPDYNFQKYQNGDGYYSLHHEHSFITPYRMLAWMIYLNDAQSGTEFLHQKKTIKPKAGRLVIWPAAWTHAHKGVTPNKGLKYIITGWFSYLPARDSENNVFYSL